MAGKNKYTTAQKISTVSMMLMLLWLTMSAPFIIPGQQKRTVPSKAGIAAQADIPVDTNEEEENNPFGNTTEEKPESGGSTLSEYLHHTDELVYQSISPRTSYNTHSTALYIAFHGELLSPPPEA